MAKQQGRVFFCTPQGREPGSSSPAPCLPTPWDESLSRPQSLHSSGLSSLRRSRCWLVPITSHIRTADRFRLRSLQPVFSVSWFVPNSAFLVQVEKRVLPCCQPGVTRQGLTHASRRGCGSVRRVRQRLQGGDQHLLGQHSARGAGFADNSIIWERCSLNKHES